MAQQVPIDGESVVEDSNLRSTLISSDLAYQKLLFVNVVYLGSLDNWVLIDAGIKGFASSIIKAAQERFASNPPKAILLTHGHFDHVGALDELLKTWDVPIYAHEREIPYLNGNSTYPPPNPCAGGGLMTALSPLYPRGPIDVSRNLKPLPDDFSVPFCPGWKWIATPGHTEGHVSFWREADRTIIAGDAFVTTKQESAYATLTQAAEIHGPPMYFTPDWIAAEESVRRLANCNPMKVITGHGPALEGSEVRLALHLLASEFKDVAVPQNRKEEHSQRESSTLRPQGLDSQIVKEKSAEDPLEQEGSYTKQGNLPLIDENISQESGNSSKTPLPSNKEP